MVTQLRLVSNMPNYVKNLKDFKCSNCGFDYQSLHAYRHSILGIVCVDCLNVELTDSKWA